MHSKIVWCGPPRCNLLCSSIGIILHYANVNKISAKLLHKVGKAAKHIFWFPDMKLLRTCLIEERLALTLQQRSYWKKRVMFTWVNIKWLSFTQEVAFNMVLGLSPITFLVPVFAELGLYLQLYIREGHKSCPLRQGGRTGKPMLLFNQGPVKQPKRSRGGAYIQQLECMTKGCFNHSGPQWVQGLF